MSHLLDVNFLLACAWSGHSDHVRANRWLNSMAEFATAPVTQMGFLRVSLSPAEPSLVLLYPVHPVNPVWFWRLHEQRPRD